MAKLRKIKSGSALSPPDNRVIAQKLMRSWYIRTVKKKSKNVVARIPVTTKNSSINTTIVSEMDINNQHRSVLKHGDKARISTERIRFYDTNTYTAGRKFAEMRYKKRLTEKNHLVGTGISTAAAARTLNSSVHNTTRQSSGENGQPDKYAESQISYAGQRMTLAPLRLMSLTSSGNLMS